MENGRVTLLESIGLPVSEIAHNEDTLPFLNEANIRYKKPFFQKNNVIIEMLVSTLNNASAMMEIWFYNENNELCASVQQKGLFVNQKTMRPARLSEKQRKAFEKYLIPD